MVSIKSVLFAGAAFTSYRDINWPRMGCTTYYRGWLRGSLWWTTHNLVSLPLLSSGMAASTCRISWLVWNWTADRSVDSFPGWPRLKSIQEPVVWAPQDQTGYLQLVLFGAFIAVLGGSANFVVQYLWSSLNALSYYVWKCSVSGMCHRAEIKALIIGRVFLMRMIRVWHSTNEIGKLMTELFLTISEWSLSTVYYKLPGFMEYLYGYI